MERICIFGSGGAGKTTLANQLGDLLDLEILHLDYYFWKPNWTESPREEWIEVQKELVKKPRWVMDGNFSATWDARLARADTFIFLDLPRNLCFYRALSRLWRYYGKTRPDIAPGCAESFDWEFLKYVWTYPKVRRNRILKALQQRDTPLHILQSTTEVQEFVMNVKRQLCN